MKQKTNQLIITITAISNKISLLRLAQFLKFGIEVIYSCNTFIKYFSIILNDLSPVIYYLLAKYYSIICTKEVSTRSKSK